MMKPKLEGVGRLLKFSLHFLKPFKRLRLHGIIQNMYLILYSFILVMFSASEEQGRKARAIYDFVNFMVQ